MNANAAFPLEVSGNGRYLVDQNGAPFLITGDAGWGLVAAITTEEAEVYLQSREDLGFNLTIVRMLEHQFCSNPPRNAYGDLPFTGRPFATPNEAYFAHVDAIINLAASHGIAVVLAPVYLGYVCGGEGWCAEIQSATLAEMGSWGRYLGNRYKDFPNIIWLIGGDADPSPVKAKLREVVNGIKTYDTNHPFTAHNQSGSYAIDPWPGESWLTLNNVYSRSTTLYENARVAYDVTPTMPFFLIEANYENEHSSTPQELRAQIYDTNLAGGCGNIFGNCPLWHFGAAPGWCSSNDWRAQLNSTGSVQMTYAQRMFNSRHWHRLVPDFNHSVMTAGFGTPGQTDYAPAGCADDGSSIIAYLPTRRTVTVNTIPLAHSTVSCWWYNPTNGQTTSIGTITESATSTFTPPSSGDWVLVLDDATLNLGPPGSAPPSAPPTVVTPASATPNPTSGTTTNLSVLGNDDGGESALTYTWAATGTPPAPVTFSVNGTNAAKNTVATFAKAGAYTLQATIADQGGQTVASSVAVTVNQTYTNLSVTPVSASVVVNGTQQFTGTARDQFGNPMTTQPSFTWTVSGGGTINAGGLFTAGSVPGGPYTITASGGGRNGTASVTVTGSNPITIGETNILGVDDSGNANLLIAQPAGLQQTAVIQSLSFYVATPSGRLRLGIYDATGPSGGPGAKKAEINEITPVAGWNTATVTVPVSLPAGTYWLAYLANSNSLHFRRDRTGTARYYGYSYGVMPATFGTSTTTVVDHWSFYATLMPGGGGNAPPTVATPAAANPNPVPGTTTNLSVLGADDGGEAALVYSWAAVGNPPAAVSFSVNGTHAARATVATFTRAGSYTIRATITDQGGLNVTSDVTVTVNQTATSVVVTPPSASVPVGGSQQFTASMLDQFGNALATQPSFSWTVSGGGTINATGRFVAGNTPGGPYTVTAASGGRNGTASVTVTGSGSIRIGETNILSIDDSGNANLLIAQSASLGQPAVIQSLSFYVTTASGKLRLGIYDATGPSGGPGAKKAETSEITPVTGWNTVTVTSPVSLAAGTYWLAYLPSSNGLHFRRSGSGTCRYYSYSYGAMPATFSRTTTNISDHWSFYGTLNP
jgi:hypothetical protein